MITITLDKFIQKAFRVSIEKQIPKSNRLIEIEALEGQQKSKKDPKIQFCCQNFMQKKFVDKS